MKHKTGGNSGFGRKVAQLQLTKYTYEDNGVHAVKILYILFAFLKNGPLSKWQLATVNYRETTKKGFTSFSWVLVHKLISEMTRLGLVQKYGRSNIKTDRQSERRKHAVNLYYPTLSGIIFALCADKSTYFCVRKGELNFGELPEEKQIGYANIISLIGVVWNIQHLDADAAKEVRMIVMDKITGINSVKDAQDLIASMLMSYAMKSMGENISDVLSAGSGERIERCMIKMAALNGAISSIEQKDIHHKLADSLEEKIIFSNLALSVIKSLYEYLSGYSWNKNERVKAKELAVEQLFVKLMISNDVAHISQTLRPTMKILKNLGGDLSDLAESNKAFSTFWKNQEKRKK